MQPETYIQKLCRERLGVNILVGDSTTRPKKTETKDLRHDKTGKPFFIESISRKSKKEPIPDDLAHLNITSYDEQTYYPAENVSW